jgi:hypothetical protein
MGYTVFGYESDSWGLRDGLEGPFRYPNGRVLYYDVKEGKYYDPRTDFYVDHDEVATLQQQIVNLIRG